MEVSEPVGSSAPTLDELSRNGGSAAVEPAPPATPAATVRCEDLVLHFFTSTGKPRKVLDRISIETRPGELLCIVGPSGCGKTTILNVVAGLLEPTSGSASVDSTPVRGVRRDVAYMTQKDTLLPWLTAVRNVHLPLEAAGLRDRKMERARELLDLVGLAGFEDSYPHQLSGGMRKRVQLARSLAQEPRVLLMDEPFGALDYQTRMLMHERFLDIWERDRKTVLFVTHDLNEAISLADRVMLVSQRPARLRQVYDVDIPRPRGLDTLVENRAYQELYQQMWAALRDEFAKEPEHVTRDSRNGRAEI